MSTDLLIESVEDTIAIEASGADVPILTPVGVPGPRGDSVDVADVIAELVGSIVQAYSDTLSALSDLTTTAFGRGLLNVASAAALRAAIELPTEATIGRLARFTAGDGVIAMSAGIYEDATGRIGIGTMAPLMPLHVEGRVAVGDAVNAARISSGTTGGAGRAFSLIDTNGVFRIWRRADGGNSATIELATGIGSDNIADASINRWDFGLTHNTNRFAVRRYTGASTADTYLSVQPTGQIGIGALATHASAHLEVASTTRGFLPPRMTTTQRDAIASPAEGLIVYNLTDHEPQFWNGSAWVGMVGG